MVIDPSELTAVNCGDLGDCARGDSELGDGDLCDCVTMWAGGKKVASDSYGELGNYVHACARGELGDYVATRSLPPSDHQGHLNKSPVHHGHPVHYITRVTKFTMVPSSPGLPNNNNNNKNNNFTAINQYNIYNKGK